MKTNILISIKSFEKIPTVTSSCAPLLVDSDFAPCVSTTSGSAPFFLDKEKNFVPILEKERNSVLVEEQSDFILVEKQNHTTSLLKNKNASKFSSIALPQRQTKYTILRSPHIDKKSRDQFELAIHKQLIKIKTDIQDLRKRLYHFKFHEMQGVQMKIVFQTKTRFSSLDLVKKV